MAHVAAQTVSAEPKACLSYTFPPFLEEEGEVLLFFLFMIFVGGVCVCWGISLSLSLLFPLTPTLQWSLPTASHHSYNYVLLHKALQDPQGTLQQCQDPQAKHKIPQTDLVRSTLWKMRRDHWWDLQLSAKPGCQFPSLTAGNWASQPLRHILPVLTHTFHATRASACSIPYATMNWSLFYFSVIQFSNAIK